LSAAEGDFLTISEKPETLELKQENDTVVSIHWSWKCATISGMPFHQLH